MQDQGNKATFSHWPRLDTLVVTQAWISLRHLPEANASKKAVLRVRCLRSSARGGGGVRRVLDGPGFEAKAEL